MKKSKKALKKPFYHQLVRIDKIYLEVKKVGLPEEEEGQLWDLVEETINTKAVDAILERLPVQRHEEFMEKFIANPADLAIIDYLESLVGDIKSHMREVFENLEKEILQDIVATSLEEE